MEGARRIPRYVPNSDFDIVLLLLTMRMKSRLMWLHTHSQLSSPCSDPLLLVGQVWQRRRDQVPETTALVVKLGHQVGCISSAARPCPIMRYCLKLDRQNDITSSRVQSRKHIHFMHISCISVTIHVTCTLKRAAMCATWLKSQRAILQASQGECTVLSQNRTSTA